MTRTQAAPNTERAVQERYSSASRTAEPNLCCPTEYRTELLKAIPLEILEKDYGCGDPSRHLRTGETVLDLGSGSGKLCFIASQVVGPAGRVIGIDMNDDMLALARRHAPDVGRAIGYSNVSFHRGHIQDLTLDLEAADNLLRHQPVTCTADLARYQEVVESMRREQPLVASDSVDVVISNCVLNLVDPGQKPRLFAEIYRVLRRGGRAVISDIVSDEDVPVDLQSNPELWSGCISGALRDDIFLSSFEAAGFYGITQISRQESPWRTVGGIEFRSLTVAAWKGKEGPCLEQNHAVIYKGPFREVQDDDGHVLRRGERTAVCGKTYAILTNQPYSQHFEPIPPAAPVPESEARPFDCTGGSRRRPPRVAKRGGNNGTSQDIDRCGSRAGDGHERCC